jgi:hypothetical protein
LILLVISYYKREERKKEVKERREKREKRLDTLLFKNKQQFSIAKMDEVD